MKTGPGPHVPRFTHDCKRCEFLGQYKEHDLYYCLEAELAIGGTVIARYSSEDSEYSSSALAVILRGAVNELAYGLHELTKYGEVPIPPRQGGPLHVAAAWVLSRELIRVRFCRPDLQVD